MQLVTFSLRCLRLQAPISCALCQPTCPSNVLTTGVQFFEAVVKDIITALRLAFICLNPAACICQIMMMLK